MTTSSVSTTKPPPILWVVMAFAAVYIIWGRPTWQFESASKPCRPSSSRGPRFIFAGPILMVAAAFLGAGWPTRRQWLTSATTGCFLLVGGNGMVVLAEREVASSITALIIATTPVWFALGEWIRPRGQRPSHRAWIGIALGIFGVGYLSFSSPSSSGPVTVSLKGLALLIAATISWATGSLLVKHLEKPKSPWMMSGAQMTAGGAVLLALAGLHGETSQFSLASVSRDSWMALGYLVVFGSWVGFSAYVWLLKVSSPSRVSTYAYVNPVVAVLLGWLQLGEALSFHTLIAAAVLLAGVIIVVWPNRPVSSTSLSKSS